MNSRFTTIFAGFLFGFVLSMIVNALLLSWTARAFGLALVLCFAFLMMLRGSEDKRARAYLLSAWFVFGYALFAIALVLLDAIFPPIT